ncbi:MAG: glycosyltransferase [Bacteroidales bacterium]|nr:glycosyltransferase [Bacteroidales bacterium]
MKILQICHKAPYPPKEGGPLAVNVLTEVLQADGHIVHIICISTPKYYVDKSLIPKDYKDRTKFDSVFIDTNVKIIPAFLNLFSSKSYNIERFYSIEFDTALKTKLIKNKYDIVQLESLFVTPYLNTIRNNSKAKIILRSHNIEYLIWERLAEETKNPLKKYYLNLLATKLKKYELALLNQYDAILTISDKDLQYYKNHNCTLPILNLPFGVNIENYNKPTNKSTEFPSLFFIGSMDWKPNLQGLNWFLNKIWLNIYYKFPGLTFYIAGRNIPETLTKSKYPQVVIVGEVENAISFIHSKAIMLVPLLSGGGIRIKIIEAMAAAKTIVSTAIGAEGIDYTDRQNILIANSVNEFCSCINLCINDKKYSDEIGLNARNFIFKNHNNKTLISELTRFYDNLLS